MNWPKLEKFEVRQNQADTAAPLLPAGALKQLHPHAVRFLLPPTHFAMSFNTLPASSTLKVESYRIAVPDAALEELQTALKVSRIAPPTYENAQEDRRFGLTREWVLQAKERWSNGFDW